MDRVRTILMYACMAALCAACDPYDELCGSDHPHKGRLQLAWNWPDDYRNLDNVELNEDKVTVLAVRRENMIKYGGMLPRPKRGTYVDFYHCIYPNPEVDENGLEVYSQTVMREGEYDILSFNALGKGAYMLTYDDFKGSNYNYFNNIKLKFTLHKTLRDDARLLPYSDMVDRNGYSDSAGYRYLMPNNINVQYAFKERVPVYNNRTTRCLFDEFVPVTQEVTFVFEIRKKEAGIFIHNIRGAISGLPSEIDMVSGIMPLAPTYSTLFTAPHKDTFDNMEPMTISVTVPLPGIVRPHTADNITGAGVLQLDLQTQWRNEETGEVCTGKTLRAGINLYKTLGENPSVSPNLSTQTCRQTKKKLRLVIRMPLQITRDKVIPNDSEFDNWIDITDPIHVDV